MANNKERKRSHKKTPNQSVSSAQSETAKRPARKKSPKPSTPASRNKKPVTEGSVSKPANRPNTANGRRGDRERKPSPSVVSRGSAAATMTMTPEPSSVPLQPCQVTPAIHSSHLTVPSALTEDRKPTPKKRRSRDTASNQPNKRSEDMREEQDNDATMSSPTASTTSTASMMSTPTPTPASPARSAVHQELQNIYHRVCQLEDQCGRLMQKLAQEIPQKDEPCITQHTDIRQERLNRLLADATKRHAALLDAHYDFLRAAHYNDSTSLRGLVNKYDIPSRLWSRGVYAFVHIARNLQPYAARYLNDHLRHCAQTLLLLAEPYFDREADGKNLPSWTEAVGDLARIGMSVRTDDAVYWRGVAHWWYSRTLLTYNDNGRPHHHFALVLACRLESLLSLCRATLCMVPFAPASNTMDALFNAGAAKMQRQGEREPLEVVVDSFVSVHEGVTKGRFPNIRQKLISLGAVIARTPSPFLASRSAMFAAINIAGLHEYGRGALAGVWRNSVDEENVVVPSPNKYVAFHILRAHLALTSDKALPHIIPWLLFMLALTKHPKVFLEVLDHRFPWKDMLWYLNEIQRKTARVPVDNNDTTGSNFNFKKAPPPRELPPAPKGYVSKLPEELLLRGFSWAKEVLSCPFDSDTQDIVNTMSLGGQLDYTLGECTRLERAQDLIRQLCDTRLLKLGDSGLEQDPELTSCLASKTEAPDYISEYEAYHEFLPDIGGESSSVTSDDIQSLCKKRDMVRQECGVQSKIENLELTTSPLAGERKPAIIFDTNLWLNELEFIVTVVESGWLRIKVPVMVMHELQKLQTFNRDVRTSTLAQQALAYIKSKGQGSSLTIVGLDGAALNEQACAEGVVRFTNDYGGLPKRGQPTMDELITRTVCKLQKGSRGGVVRALLVTNDKNMRILALTQSVAVSSGAEFMNMYGEESGERRNETPGIRSMRSRKSELSV
ncbi:hypothetical protein B0I72DRAFT_132213 [Yarrowia lipolytica]|uniref:YALI0F21362p n=2 Tax=Yarrowia lipolytica TaxID=4952 RepID=Q6C0V6_YARLI|nr:YALI0F21362p [Yarrowia lipolytica CLIB122]AOW07513.1 hypothetical protein YALI1_F28202g [Yarrowia lipolytica]KAB8286568.1 hypothetical protein BKA91DRAFT_131868 [Yarrowia lipolytica]KAE8173487.1 hypothetical protein BKA90DRAFT_135465 [Yarrowia lipolytica]KAJ8055415.1 hypothetical protein LXG23DRAFT_47449 [Yarrowia lipolytica]QNP99773.1 Hypothetical protein YALI2_E01089g [Yarrowia lipolytica]|eukprot:XP_505706.1 YALI0F21362p [Yarrowia lipolytica CLIB122]